MERQMKILLDLDGTVLDFEKSERHAFFSTMKQFSIPVQAEEYHRYRALNRALWDAVERGETTVEAIRPLRFQRILETRGKWDWETLSECFVSYLAKAGFALPGAVPFIAKLHKQYRICVVTNGLRHSQENRLRLSGLSPYVDLMITSQDSGVPKPASDMFLQAMKSLNDENTENYVMIGDSLAADIAGAHGVGIRAMWYHPGGEALQTELPIAPEWIVQNYQEAEHILLHKG